MIYNKTKWNGLDAVEVVQDDIRMVVVTEFGPRISFFGKRSGRNLLFWDTADRSRGDWKLRGGHRVWNMTRGADETEMTYRPDNGPCTIEADDTSVTVWGEIDPIDRAQRGIRITVSSVGDFFVDSIVRNRGEMLMSSGVWCLTCTLPVEHTRYGFPLGDGSGWDTFKSVQFRQWGPCDGDFGDDQFIVGHDTLVIDPKGRQAKMMFCIPRGLGCMSDPESDTSFAKYVEYNPAGRYPEGCNWAVYIGPENYMVEFETMGPVHTLKPGDMQIHREIWTLSEHAVNVESHEELMMIQPGQS